MKPFFLTVCNLLHLGEILSSSGEMQYSAFFLLHVIFPENDWFLMSNIPYSLGNSLLAGDVILTNPWYYW